MKLFHKDFAQQPVCPLWANFVLLLPCHTDATECFSYLKVLLLRTKIVQGEWSGKEKLKGFAFTLPSRSRSYLKIVQGEWEEKREAKFLRFSQPSRSLSHIKTAQAERGEKQEKKLLRFTLPRRSLSQAR